MVGERTWVKGSQLCVECGTCSYARFCVKYAAPSLRIYRCMMYYVVCSGWHAEGGMRYVVADSTLLRGPGRRNLFSAHSCRMRSPSWRVG